MFSRVLFPTDFSAYANSVFACLPELKAAGTQKVTVLHVRDERTMIGRPKEQLAEFDREEHAT